jgi:hypothetical protein
MANYFTHGMWSDVQTTVSGVATFHPTVDGTGTGTALFANIFSVQATGEGNTAIMTAAPTCSVKAISGDMKTVTVNAITGAVLGILGATMVASADGTKVHALVLGN